MSHAQSLRQESAFLAGRLASVPPWCSGASARLAMLHGELAAVDRALLTHHPLATTHAAEQLVHLRRHVDQLCEHAVACLFAVTCGEAMPREPAHFTSDVADAQAPAAPPTGNAHPPSWPQKGVSQLHLPELPPLCPQPPRPNGVKPPKVMYCLPGRPRGSSALYHFFSEDVVAVMMGNLEKLFYSSDDAKRRLWGMEKLPASEYDSADADEFACFSSHALALYLHIHFERDREADNLFRIVPRSLLAVSVILDQLLIWQQQNLTSRFRDHLRSVLGVRAPRASSETETDETPTPTSILEVWDQLMDCDIAVVPSVLRLCNKRDVQQWSAVFVALRLLEQVAGVSVFPSIDFQAHLVNPVAFLRHLADRSPPYVPLLEKETQAQVSGPSHASAPLQNSQQQHESRDTFVNVQHSCFLRSDLLLPVILLTPDSGWLNGTASTLSDIQRLLNKLTSASASGGWQVEPDQYMLTTCDLPGGRSKVVPKCCRSNEEVLEGLKDGMRGSCVSLKRRRTQFRLQPRQRDPQRYPPRDPRCDQIHLFFSNGEYLFAMLTTRRAKNKYRKKDRNTSAPPSPRFQSRSNGFEEDEWITLDLRGVESIFPLTEKCLAILPQLVDVGVHILSACESYCRMASENGVVRIDLGVEFADCPSGVSEAELQATQKRPGAWQPTGEGFIMRAFLSEAGPPHSPMDVNCFSVKTNYAIGYAAAYSAAQHLTRVLDQRREAGVLRQVHALPGEAKLEESTPESRARVEEQLQQLAESAEVERVSLKKPEAVEQAMKREFEVLAAYARQPSTQTTRQPSAGSSRATTMTSEERLERALAIVSK